MAFGNVVIPETTVHEMKGIWALLDLINNPQSKDAQAFLEKLSAEKDAAVAAAKSAADDHAAVAQKHKEAATFHAEATAMKAAADKLMTEAQKIKTDYEARMAEQRKRWGA